MRDRTVSLLILVGTAGLVYPVRADDARLRREAAVGLRKAVEFFRGHVGVQGGYLWRYSEDLARREGEGRATATQAWVQPPGTPTVGLAFLAAHEATGEKYYLDAVRETAHALVRGQLRSGGWDYRIEFDPRLRRGHAYRVEGGTGGRNVTTLDDNTTQSAVRFLMRADQALEGKDRAIREAVVFALESLQKAQYPNGAWPQRFDRFPDPEKYPIRKASFPDSWPREYPARDYRGHYTFNDNTISDTIEVMLDAFRIYGEKKYRDSALKAGGFILLAQLPAPQPGWAQQYDVQMHPAWARKFEPPAVTGGEAQKVLQTLLLLYRETGEKKFLEPIPHALDYYRRSLLPDGRLARFYELRTNRPLYFTRDYRLTYRDDDLPTHYGFKVSSRLEAIAREHERLRKQSPKDLKQPRPARPFRTASAAQVKAVLDALDARGRWIEKGRLRSHGADDPTRRVIQTQTFASNVHLLAGFLAAGRRDE